jgi:hypothetical protein
MVVTSTSSRATPSSSQGTLDISSTSKRSKRANDPGIDSISRSSREGELGFFSREEELQETARAIFILSAVSVISFDFSLFRQADRASEEAVVATRAVIGSIALGQRLQTNVLAFPFPPALPTQSNRCPRPHTRVFRTGPPGR